ncbi:MAG: imelysin family protein [Hyphomicrobiales bacterium]
MRVAGAMLALVLGASPVSAGDVVGFDRIIAAAIQDFIVPGYERLTRAAGSTEAAVRDLCAAPSPARLEAARTAFGDAVAAHAAVEVVRFGPVREANRQERLNFWPDRKGLGLRQVQQIIAAGQTPSSSDLAAKSVAVQGLGALEYVLFGDGAAALAGPPGAARCAFGSAIAGALRTTADEILADWRADGGAGARMLSPGPDNPLHRSQTEVLQTLIKALTEELQFLSDTKIKAVLGASPDEVREKRAPFWRSGQTRRVLEENAASVTLLFETAQMALALDKPESSMPQAIAFDMRQARAAIGRVEEPFEKGIATATGHELLRFATIALDDAKQIIGERYAADIGATLGFNSLDGD